MTTEADEEGGEVPFFATLEAAGRHALDLLVEKGIVDLADLPEIAADEVWTPLEGACFEWLETQSGDVDEFGKPHRPEVAAAMLILKIADLKEALVEVAATASARRGPGWRAGGIDNQAMSDLLNAAAHIGALGEVFRADLGGFLDPKHLVREAGRKGAERRKVTADAWREIARQKGMEIREGRGGWNLGKEDVTMAVQAHLKTLGIKIGYETINTFIGNEGLGSRKAHQKR